MGLCKCPKRKVTNLFCFEHRVNVCEHCLIEHHPRCVVQSYLNWLKDSDYVPNCALCGISLLEEDVVRLICYDVFHTGCLERHYKQLPLNTAPDGYRCFSCDSPVFPMPNQGGTVIDKLKLVLSKFNWARVGLGLPLIEEPAQQEPCEERSNTPPPPAPPRDEQRSSLHGSIIRSTPTLPPSSNVAQPTESNISFASDVTNSSWIIDPPPPPADVVRQATAKLESTVLSMEADEHRAVSRKAFFSTSHDFAYDKLPLGGDDADGVDKYKRRPALSWLSRWLKSRMLRGRGRETRAIPRRGLVVLVIAIIAISTLVLVAYRAGRGDDDASSEFDPLRNPNVHVQRPPPADDDRAPPHDPLLAVQPAAGGV